MSKEMKGGMMGNERKWSKDVAANPQDAKGADVKQSKEVGATGCVRPNKMVKGTQGHGPE